MPNSYIMVDIVIDSIDFTKNPPTASYSGSSTPGGSNSNNPVVATDGTINLNNVNKGNVPSRALISFTFGPALTNVVFTDVELKDASGGPAGSELAKAVTGGQVVVLDLDTDGASYKYCILVSNQGMASQRLDPTLVNRGRT